jgi:DNA-binding MarR family transcriptional regulator
MVRGEDAASGLSGPRASALSVVVFRGPLSMSELAAVEQVRLPTMSRLVTGLEAEGLVVRAKDPRDARVQRVRTTPKGRKLLLAGKARRVARLAAELRKLSADEREVLRQAALILDTLLGPRRGPDAR